MLALGDPRDHITHVTLRYGFSDSQDVPAGLAVARDMEGLDIPLKDVTYVLSRITVHRSSRPGMDQPRKRLFGWLVRNATDPTHYFGLPIGQTVVIGARVNF